MYFVDNVNLEPRMRRPILRILNNFPNIIHARIAGRVDFDDVHVIATARSLSYPIHISRTGVHVGLSLDR